MSRGNKTCLSPGPADFLRLQILWLPVLLGCCQLAIPSHRVASQPPTASEPGEMIVMDDAGVACPMLPCFAGMFSCLAGPFLPRETQAVTPTIQPPHSRFHPVPTRPVFAPPVDGPLLKGQPAYAPGK